MTSIAPQQIMLQKCLRHTSTICIEPTTDISYYTVQVLHLQATRLVGLAALNTRRLSAPVEWSFTPTGKLQGWQKNTGRFFKVYKSCTWWCRKVFGTSKILEFIWNKRGVLNVATFKCYLHWVQRNHITLKIHSNLNMRFTYCTQFPQNSQSMLIIKICRSRPIEQVYHMP